ncbi:hypothetical protein ACFVHB_27870 [Kitasatospora sp. NPDC127111]|uniref:hypothetical protein n=1 Tax=Kitasatospora sp. NPDC127111 TaxID=3345363 RepID=UPI003638D817
MHRHRAVGLAVLVLLALGTASACDSDNGTTPPRTTTPPPAGATPPPAPTSFRDVENPTDLVHGSAAAATRPAH